MPQPRKPSNILALKGSFTKNPERARARANEPKPDVDDVIGDAPERMSESARGCWAEICDLAHPGTLSKADRLIVEYGAELLASLRAANWDVAPALMARLEMFLGRLGMTPADRSRVSVKKPPAASDPLDEFASAG